MVKMSDVKIFNFYTILDNPVLLYFHDQTIKR